YCGVILASSTPRLRARPRAAASDVSAAEPNSPIAAVRSLPDGVTPALANSASTNCDGVSVVGYDDVKRARCTNSVANRWVLSSSSCCQPVWLTTTPWAIPGVSAINSPYLTGTGAPGRLP